MINIAIVSASLHGYSDGLFSDFEENGLAPNGERKKCYTRPEQQYNNIFSVSELKPSKREMTEFKGWLHNTVKLLPSELERGDIDLRMGIFLHFFRLDISALEITRDNVATYEIWHERNHFVMEEYVSYIKVPLDSEGSFVWWLDSPEPDLPENERKHVYLCHRLQTFTETQKRVRVNARSHWFH